MTQALIIPTDENWVRVDTSGGPLTFTRRATGSALQFSGAQHRPGNLSAVGTDMLVGICRKFTGKVEKAQEIGSGSGGCRFGLFGTVTVQGSEPAHFQVWVLSNGQAFILVSHTCNLVPGAEEIAEANEIALDSVLG
jgi:hypothetical protein